MGQTCSTKEVNHGSEALRATQLDELLKSEMRSNQKEIKLLLLGAGDSGKSTIFKQIRLIHGTGFSAEETKRYIGMVRSHCVENLSELVAGARSLQIDMPVLPKTTVDDVIRRAQQDGITHRETVNNILQIWKSPEMQRAYLQRHSFQLADGAAYFFEHLERISLPEYSPTTEDMLRCRVRTTGLVELNFVVDTVMFRLLDVGGQRNERRKWIHCFECVQAILFIAAISEYDQTLFEDHKTNRVLEALDLFKEISSSSYFLHTSIILFLNKKDIFEQKIKTVDLRICFPDYTGTNNPFEAIQFIQSKFLGVMQARQEVYVHVTCATDTSNVRYVFEVVRESVLFENLTATGFV